MKTKTIRKISLAILAALGLAQTAPAFAAPVLIYSNEVLEENANKLILDNDDTTGDITIQFGNTLNESLYWDEDGGRTSTGVFTFTDDVLIEGALDLTEGIRVHSNAANGYVELVGDQATGDYDLTINNGGLTADLTVTGEDLKKLADLTVTASEINNAVTNSHEQNTDTGTNSTSFRVDSDATNGYIDIVANQATGNFDLTINNNGLTADLTVTGADLQKLASLTSTAAQIDTAVAASHDQNTDTGTDSDNFNVNSNGADATVQFGNTTDGEITYDNSDGSFDFDGNRLTNIGDPEAGTDATNKNYVDDLINGLSWRDPVEHPSQLVDGATGGIRAGGKIFVSDYTQVIAEDTLDITYADGTTTLTLRAKDVPTASACQFKSGTAATDNLDLTQSILDAINACSLASDFSPNSTIDGASVYLIHDDTSTTGNGTITPSGSGFVAIDLHDGRAYADMLPTETRVSRSNDVAFTWDADGEQWVSISGPSSIPDATTTIKGKVELATDGETAAGVVVQGDDSRLHYQNTDTGTDQTTYRIDTDATNGYIDITANQATGNFDLTVNNAGLTADLTVTGTDLQKLVDIASTAAGIDSAVLKQHDQNTDTGTNNNSFRVDSDAANGYVELVGDNATGNYDLVINNSGISADLTVTAADLKKLVDLTVTASEINDAISNSHEQNTDTGTTSNTFTLDTDNTGGNVTLVFGDTVGEYLRHDGVNFIFSDDILMESDNVMNFRDADISIGSSVDGQLDIAADNTASITAPTVDINGNTNVSGNFSIGSTGVSVATILDEDDMASDSATALATQQSIKAYVDDTTGNIASDKADKVSGATNGNLASLDASGNLADSGVAANNVVTLDGTQTITGEKTFDDIVINGEISGTAINTDDTLTTVSDTEVASSEAVKNYVDNAVSDIDWSAIDTRTKTIPITMNDLTVAQGSSSQANLYNDSEAFPGHEYYYVKTNQSSLQNLTMKIKVKLPEDFVEFTPGMDHISLNYKNDGSSNADSKVDISVQDASGNPAFTPVTSLFSAAWANFVEEFTGGSFAPSAGDYIYITVTGHASKSGANYFSPYIGELYLTYTGK